MPTEKTGCSKLNYIYIIAASFGGVAEWSNAAVLKTAVLKGTVGSNPTPSAILI